MDFDQSRPHQVSAASDKPFAGDSPKQGPQRTGNVQRVKDALNKARPTPDFGIHPGLIPGISVEDTGANFRTRRSVFIIALLVSLGVLAWAIVAPQHLNTVGVTMQGWVVTHFGWLFNLTVIAIAIFMLVIGFGPTGRIRLGADDSTPEFSTSSWISMLFAAGLGIGLIFYGPLEPLSHFTTPPPWTDAEAGTGDAILPALTDSVLHQASFAWCIYALVGGALAYASYRRGRLPLISSLFEPVFPDGNNRVLGKIIDIFAVLVTLFGTATSLGIGALQIRTGTSIVTGAELGNGYVVVVISVLTAVFTISAVAGIKKGIRLLSNVNMTLVITLAVFVLVAGPTFFILDLVPSTVISFAGNLPDMLAVFASQGPVHTEYLTAYTTLYWAWWISWSPFVGMFIAKISKGRTLREFVTVVVFIPAGISTLWFIIFGGNAIWMNLNGMDMSVKGAGENVMFDLMANLPFSSVMWIVCLVAILIFFVTAADSAANVMGSMSQSGRPIPSKPVTIIWAVALGLIAMFLLLAGGRNALSGLQSIMVTCALPFVFILIGVMVSWGMELRSDPLMIRRRYAAEAIRSGVRRGIDEHGDDFAFGVDAVPEAQGAGADFESDDPALTEWYTDSLPVITAEQQNKHLPAMPGEELVPDPQPRLRDEPETEKSM
ncbi:BCCT family transporter [Glutamicibacter sp. MNS18]|uniref:BCCT family transporter n=1 Tax=Glutamicibacter sp. MNS18 TaxID=2989817 RepID=UPI002235EB0A|nr:BCCT family transporter [Glutamicibacter sp. MNS18]MCW4466414.1 BCCT family transporter [Glutamicibacter sp. MNS18]